MRARKGLNSTSGAQFVALPLVKPVVWFVGAVVNWRSRSVAKSAFYYQEPFWLLFICVHLLVVLIQGNCYTPGDTTRSDTNWFSRGDSTTDISRHMFFLFTRDNYTSGLVTIFLQFHCLSSYRYDSFPLQLIDQITFFLSQQMCHVN